MSALRTGSMLERRDDWNSMFKETPTKLQVSDRSKKNLEEGVEEILFF